MEQAWQTFAKRWKFNKITEPKIPKVIKKFVNNDVEKCKINGVSLLIFINFYAALDTFMDEVYGDLLITHRSVYITHFKYIGKYKMIVAYDHVSTGSSLKEFMIKLDSNAMAELLKLRSELTEIMLASKQTEDSPFRQIM